MTSTDMTEIYDPEAFAARIGNDAQLGQELMALMRRDTPTLLAQLQQALGAGDASSTERAAHTLKGAVANFSARRAQRAAERVESLARAGDLASARRELVTLEREMACLLTAFGQHLLEAQR